MTKLQSFDPDSIRRLVHTAGRRAGDDGWLVQYDANDISAFVTQSRLLPHLRAASGLVKQFDRMAKHQAGDGAVFAGGGRGLFWVPESLKEQLVEVLPREYRARTRGSLAVAAVPCSNSGDDAVKRVALVALQARLTLAKDAAEPPEQPLIEDTVQPNARCVACNAAPQDADQSFVHGGETFDVCPFCLRILQAGKRMAQTDAGSMGVTLSDIAHPSNKVAVVSGDGNNMGAFFEQMKTLEDRALASVAVQWLFEHALERATEGLEEHEFVAPVVGGDDIRLFMRPEGAFERMETLAQAIHQGIAEIKTLWKPRPAVAEALDGIGIGIGLVIGPDTFPASTLIGFAHALEVSAKRICGSGTKRSALDFALMRSGESIIESLGNVRGDHRLVLDAPKDQRSLSRCLKRAQRLTVVPSSQRARVMRWFYAQNRVVGDGEAFNRMRAQVARSLPWQQFFGAAWTEPGAFEQAMPSHAELEMARVLEITRSGGA